MCFAKGFIPSFPGSDTQTGGSALILSGETAQTSKWEEAGTADEIKTCRENKEREKKLWGKI